ncbi:hypothetical protein ASPZODRAFT_158963 [Penicilliopsis zonata CBS 506.65]|uniref:Uncharacterized protein n=1 Tax=Penicilliopsis zonata CBS 506.65 TaxID=1073090 RepID=A0A1L9SI95_9EURO|nr:hypothetical protein ASPZODRAFT_158963 [Penicilliopsis zonata CBS 506.65]OJJ46950.1 hypothetical protein ASPZODRAFT_158963 [Penicilliopsis zonata CBS 506.65]
MSGALHHRVNLSFALLRPFPYPDKTSQYLCDLCAPTPPVPGYHPGRSSRALQ